MTTQPTSRIPTLGAMRIALWMLAVSALLTTGCDEPLTGPADTPEEGGGLQTDSSAFVLDHRAPAKHTVRGLFSGATRQELGDGIAHYQFEVRLGPGKFDVVRLHRVVRERRPRHPVRTDGNIFMVHGASQDFGDIYLYAGTENPTPQTSSPLHLAANGIDVWGIDLAWTLVPKETTDLSFMKDWGVERDADHTLAALSIARFLRGITGQGFGRMNLLGFSYSAPLAYVAAGREAQQHWRHRDIGGIVPVETGLVVKDESRRQMACITAVAGREMIADGNVQRTTDGPRTIHHLATTAPNDDSPLPPFEGFTNYEAALLFSMVPPFWHFVGVDFNTKGVPVGLLYSDPDRWINLLGGAPPHTTYMPRLPGVEIAETRCGEKDVSLDDHLSEIEVPTLYIGAGGGFGVEEGEWTTARTASDDVTIHEVSLQPEAKRNIDYGHADLWIGTNADDLVWEVLRGWLANHSARAPRPPVVHEQRAPAGPVAGIRH